MNLNVTNLVLLWLGKHNFKYLKYVQVSSDGGNPEFSTVCEYCDVFVISPPASIFSSSMLLRMLSYSSSTFTPPRIRLSTSRAFWVSPFCKSHRGLSGRKRKPRNCSAAGTTDKPNIYLYTNTKMITKTRFLYTFVSHSHFLFFLQNVWIWLYLKYL